MDATPAATLRAFAGPFGVVCLWVLGGYFFEVLEGGSGTAYSLAVLGKGLRGVGLCWCSKAGEVEGFRVCAFGV